MTNNDDPRGAAMMALVGFAIGYVVGVQQGKEGMARLIESWGGDCVGAHARAG